MFYGYIVRCESSSGVSFGIRRADKTTEGFTSRYFKGIGGARAYADEIGMKIIGTIGCKDNRRQK